ncbi:MAG: ACT domain-containing protein [Planctomycetes bacterium]|nr:ACT domain-containing protein [Planctomycetota bacterium]MCK5473412.1 ACT domain-containing protein [Planctomycetota bacterium]
MYIAKQFSIFMVNKPGVLGHILSEFARAKINVIAMTMMDSVEHGVMRVIFASPTNAKKVLSELNMSYNETDVLCLNLANTAGALAEVAQKLAKNHVNISYAYCTAGARGGRTTGVLKVADVNKAIKILEKGLKKTTKSKPTVRRSRASKK